jgi:predicted ribosomally synthesized peptide with SipW-like signal peptide
MRKVGKYEKMRKNALLSSYITSVLCLVLCVTMFFGTTAAWFTDTTTSEKNQIYVGTLAVDLGFAAVTKESNGQETTYTAVAETVPIFAVIKNRNGLHLYCSRGDRSDF